MKECDLIIYGVFNDRNAVNRTIEEVIEIDASEIRPGHPLPGWKFRPGIPVVEYYDGESLDIGFEGKHFNVIVGGEQVEIFSVLCPENIHVTESREVDIRLGKVHRMEKHPAWTQMRAHGSLSAMVLNALPVADKDPDAARHFLRIFTVSQNLFLLAPCAVGLIKEYADKDNPYALFALGRYHLCTRIDEDSLDKAKEYICRAHELGLPEGTASLSTMYDYGDFGLVDRSKARELLGSALAKECDYAAEIHLRYTIFGMCGIPKNPGKALIFIERLLEEDIRRHGQGEENPMWYYYRGCAKQETEGFAAALEDYRKAAEMGVTQAWADIAIACSHNDNEELVDKDVYIKAIEYGKTKRDSLCHYLSAMSKVEEYEKFPKWKKIWESKRLMANLEYAFSMGSFFAAESLGDIHYYGEYDVEEDNAMAWQWYAQGALLGNVTCYEKMFGMMHDHYIDQSLEFKDMVALQGARLGSKKLLGETVMAYTYGRLTEFAAEIEQYYEPVFDNPDDDVSDDDTSGDEQSDGDTSDDGQPDDDGRFDAYV